MARSSKNTAASVHQRLLDKAPSAFADAATAVKIFLKPVVVALIDQKPFQGIRKASGPWQ
jgi:hypothetical protein